MTTVTVVTRRLEHGYHPSAFKKKCNFKASSVRNPSTNQPQPMLQLSGVRCRENLDEDAPAAAGLRAWLTDPAAAPETGTEAQVCVSNPPPPPPSTPYYSPSTQY